MENAKQDVKRYDSHPDMAAVEKLCKHLQAAMQNDDGKWVAVSDPEEVKRVEQWAEKHLGAGKEKAKHTVEAVAREMHNDHHKNRVTFYYLMAKKLGKLGHIPS
ncbi:MAG: DUF2853 family protein [Candidatus Tokpelaia sp.]|uniref:DUF2853 family protein n=1 Tax=Candidatus Tokpelaia sp. TaxID=2233777 RepID=UPI00123A569D|nr:DUF2853 family protein [Candidatus Tokpelaia sp.]KAA6204894.1 MAG: DUF2853 family protein [Candidatus Tokpelaia sp.]KAA6206590.1 MAG: DUF2853 family protein [Candidatus Tokpelaia sp.]KAA6405888.1 hypothetical protein DPQ22_02700 [Candidatus Tokpelaia sp.]